MSEDKKNVSLLLVGRDGNGKSSTGNSILGNKKHFNPTSSSSSAGLEIKQALATVGNYREVTVTEIAGLEYPGSDYAGNFETTLREIEETIGKNTKGFDAIIFVLKYGTRFTKQEKDALLMIKSIFGLNVLKEFGVIVVTCGDSFELDVEEEDNQTFEEWCQVQTGEVKKLFEDCAYRCVLFNNRTKDDDKMEVQREKLFSLVDLIPCPYTLKEYKEAEKGQTEILVQTKLPQLEKYTNEKMDEVWKALNKIDQEFSLPSCNILELSTSLKNIQTKLLDLKKYLQDEDRNTGVLKQLFCAISIAEMRIDTKLKIAQQRLQVVTPSETWVIVPVAEWDGSDFCLQNITETVSIRKCTLDGAGKFSSSSDSDKDVPGCGIVLLEICKTNPESQTKAAEEIVQPKAAEEVVQPKAAEEIVQPKAAEEVKQPKAAEEVVQPKAVEEILQPKAVEEIVQPKAVEEVVQPKAAEEVVQPKAAEEVVQPKAAEEIVQPKAAEEVVQPKAAEEVVQPKAAEEVVQPKAAEEIVQPKAAEEIVQPKAAEEVVQPKAAEEIVQSKAVEEVVQPKAVEEVAQDQGRSTQLRDIPQTSTVLDHTGHNKRDDDLINTKITFETISTILNNYNYTNALCLISKYKQKLTKQEIEAVIKVIKETYDTNRVYNQSILILTCDNDNLEVENDQMFTVWCQEITGSDKRLLDLCEKRCVLLNPWTKDQRRLVSPKTRLLQYVADLNTRNTSKNDGNDINNAVTDTKSAKPEPETKSLGLSSKASSLFSSLTSSLTSLWQARGQKTLDSPKKLNPEEHN